MATKSTVVLKALKLASKLKTPKKNKSAERYQSQGQNAPQSKAWTEPQDELVKAKPIGYRWTTLGAKKLGKSPTAKPSIQDINNFKGKSFKVKGELKRYVYIERRVDKSDKSVKAKFNDGGMMAKGGSTDDAILMKDGLFATQKVIWNRNGKTKSYYVVYVMKGNERFVNFYDLKKDFVEQHLVSNLSSEAKNKNLKLIKTFSDPIKNVEVIDIPLKDLNYSEMNQYIENKYADQITDAKFYFLIHETGDIINLVGESMREQHQEIFEENADYTESNFEEKSGGYTIQDFSTITSSDGVELEEVHSGNTYNQSYLGGADFNYRIYNDKDADKYFLIALIHGGGDIRSGYKDAFIFDGDSEDKVFSKFYGLISGSGSIRISFDDNTEASFDSEQDSDVWYFRTYDGRFKGLAKEFIEDFETFGSWNGDEFLEKTVEIANEGKRVRGYAQGGETSNNDLFKEGGTIRQDNYSFESIRQINRMADGGMMARGGSTSFSGRQYPNYNEDMDGNKSAKPVGYRYTDRLAKRLGVSKISKPTTAHIEKYLGRGVYMEKRQDKSDMKPRPQSSRLYSLEDGGMMAKGGKVIKFTPNEMSRIKQYAQNISELEYETRGLEFECGDFADAKEQLDRYYTLETNLYRELKKKYGNNNSLIKAYGDATEKFADGGMMADGGIMAKGGMNQVGRQYPNYSEEMDGNKSAKPVGYRYTDRLAKRLGVSKISKPTTAHIEKYLGRGVYMEKRQDKSDMKPRPQSSRLYSLEDGGMMAKGGVVSRKTKSLWNSWTPKQRYHFLQDHYVEIEDSIDEDDLQQISRMDYEELIELSTISQSILSGNGFIDINDSLSKHIRQGVYADGGMMARGGMNQVGRQYPNYSEEMDGQKSAKPVGYRYTDRLAKRLGVSKISKPTTAHIEKYLGKGVYYERRQDHSDMKPRPQSSRLYSLEDGGMMAKGGISSRKSLRQQAIELLEDSINYKFRRTDMGSGYYFTLESPYKGQLGGEVIDSKFVLEIYDGEDDKDEYDNWKEDLLQFGYDDFFKKMKENNLDIFIEYIQQDDETFMKRGGNVKYLPNSDIKSITTKSGKVVSQKDILDGAYLKKSAKLEEGGMMEEGGIMAKGGVQRIANRDAREYTENMLPFMANNLEGKTLGNGDYVVLSYGYYPIWFYSKADNQYFGNSTKYSVSTSKHMSQSRPTYDAKMLTRNELEQTMLKNSSKYESGGILDGILGSEGQVHNVGGTSFSTTDLTSHLDIMNPNF